MFSSCDCKNLTEGFNHRRGGGGGGVRVRVRGWERGTHLGSTLHFECELDDDAKSAFTPDKQLGQIVPCCTLPHSAPSSDQLAFWGYYLERHHILGSRAVHDGREPRPASARHSPDPDDNMIT
jgi:hypothetical protein